MPARILVVEDEATIVDLITAALQREGHEITVTDSCAECLTLVAENDFDLILMDIRINEGDGATAIRAIAKDIPDARVVVVSGFTNIPELRGSLATTGVVVGWVSKPFKLAQLSSAVSEALAGS